MEEDEVIRTNSNKTFEKKVLRQETSVNSKDSINWIAYKLFLRNNYPECLDLLNKHSKDQDGIESHFSLYIRSQIKRLNGEVNESLDLLRKCYGYNENDILVMREIGKNLVLVGKFKMAIDIFDEILSRNENDWESFHIKGICNMNLKDYETAMACFNRALDLNTNEQTLIQIGKLHVLIEDYKTAIDKYQEAANMTGDNAELLSTIGALQLKLGNVNEAFEQFSSAMLYDSNFSNALLGVASIHQDKFEYEQALIKYKLASFSNPNSPLVWNNIGLCFFAKQKFIAAVTCLKKAIYLDPFEWIIAYNLGLVYLHQKLYASAFHYMNAAANLKTDFHLIFMYLGIILSQLNDIYNAISYYDKSLELDENYLTYFNYTVSLIKNEMLENAKDKFKSFYKLYHNNRDENAEYDKDILEVFDDLKKKLL
jgi:Bardet-Biedl syndrome 4 protein